MERQYYSQRMGLTNTGKIDLDHLKKIFIAIYDTLFDKDYFGENIGCLTTNYKGFPDFSQGKLGSDENINILLYSKLRKENLWPIYLNIEKYSKDLFNIANNFNIRHNNESQKADYGGIWLNWIFYLFLSTIHVMTRIIKRHNEKGNA